MEAALCLEDYLRKDLKRADGALGKLASDMAEAVALDLAEYGSN